MPNYKLNGPPYKPRRYAETTVIPFTSTRQDYNKAILNILSEYVEKNPDIRFWQMLFNLDLVRFKPDSYDIQDDYNVESSSLLTRVEERYSGPN